MSAGKLKFWNPFQAISIWFNFMMHARIRTMYTLSWSMSFSLSWNFSYVINLCIDENLFVEFWKFFLTYLLIAFARYDKKLGWREVGNSMPWAFSIKLLLLYIENDYFLPYLCLTWYLVACFSINGRILEKCQILQWMGFGYINLKIRTFATPRLHSYIHIDSEVFGHTFVLSDYVKVGNYLTGYCQGNI